MFKFGARLLAELEGVHPAMVAFAHKTLELSTQDFGVYDGLRTREEQMEILNKGSSTTMNSKHLRQPDGFGHAVDLVPWIAGKYRWEWPPGYVIAEAARRAAEALKIRVRWGGHWAELTGTTASPEALVMAYVKSRKKLGKDSFLDAPHFELIP
jgi:peptidoglycan L-alanyl-D-glutamate endopeptidase CwlK